ncbi:MAG: hypothetical protein ACEPO8_15045 [Rhodothermaceae bacterium]
MRTESAKSNLRQDSVLNGVNSFRIEPKNSSSNNVDISFDFRKMEINVDMKILENPETREELVSLVLKHIKKRNYSTTVELTTTFISDKGSKEYFVTMGVDDIKNKSDKELISLVETKFNSLLDKAHKNFLKKSNLPVFS